MDAFITKIYYIGLIISIIGFILLFFCGNKAIKQHMLSLLLLLVGTGFMLPGMFMDIPKHHKDSTAIFCLVLFLIWGYGMLINIIDLHKKFAASAKQLSNELNLVIYHVGDCPSEEYTKEIRKQLEDALKQYPGISTLHVKVMYLTHENVERINEIIENLLDEVKKNQKKEWLIQLYQTASRTSSLLFFI